MHNYKRFLTDGRQLKAARVVVGLTMREMGDAAGLNRNTIMRIESLGTLPHNATAADEMAEFFESMGITFTLIDGKAGIFFPAETMRKRKHCFIRPNA